MDYKTKDATLMHLFLSYKSQIKKNRVVFRISLKIILTVCCLNKLVFEFYYSSANLNFFLSKW